MLPLHSYGYGNGYGNLAKNGSFRYHFIPEGEKLVERIPFSINAIHVLRSIMAGVKKHVRNL